MRAYGGNGWGRQEFKRRCIDINAINEYIACMASLTVRKISDELKQALRVRAAQNGRSMEEHVRVTLERDLGLQSISNESNKSWVNDIVTRFQEIGGVELELPDRGVPRDPPDFSDRSQKG
jgi:antitoxin FitA